MRPLDNLKVGDKIGVVVELLACGKRGRYRVLHEFVDIGAGHDGGNAWCRLRQVRQYENGDVAVADGQMLAMNDQTPELRAVMKIYAESKFALECRLESPKGGA